MIGIKDLPIQKKLMAVIMTVATLTLLLSSAGIVYFDLEFFKRDMVRNLTALARTAGENSRAALAFDDAPNAKRILSSLKADPQVLSAAIYDSGKRKFADYVRDPDAPFVPPTIDGDKTLFIGDHMEIVQPILLEGETVGTIYLRAHLREFNNRIKTTLLTVGGIFVFTLLVTFLVGVKLQRIISQPILSLAGTAKRISLSPDYSLRAVKQSEDELGILVERFNEMLDQIQERDAALHKAYEEMEHRVEERTKELQRSNQELTDFASIASHDLQEPLRKIITFADRLKAGYESVLDETAMEYLGRMQNASTRMRSLIDDLLKLSRVTTKAQPFVPVDLNHTVKEVLEDLEVLLKNSGGTVKIENLPTVMADSSQMRQLFQNLIGNALKYRKEGEPPVVALSGEIVDGRFCEIRVEDNGIGFDQKFAERIFKPFERLHGRSQFEGSGIGLAICQKIVVRHGGTIAAQGEPGKGSAFIITLPIKHV
ncbi:MAG: HAMP domain-containing protein [Nitrospinae bacterium]|nr:HAMP domain-containing protein [Nitrospinota bacterium]